ncbi:hypothetical protein [Rhizobium sp. CNPSo 3490]|uniref:hypothetical protein n=1 Tax=Rhizobium sp. CNPSo 3490 TaxID=3021407 RepID=UPI002551B97D|nr:hypothetical protein [Rhizobium sp. CNPSo 3490]MDK4733945.1 hypothetical protein [Rhizobium sp. CNPSo 3490]
MEDNLVLSLAVKPKTHLEQYLSYYVGRTKPGYAVLVVGEWGSGKTYQVRRALPDSHAHYVTLFGLATPQDVEAQVFAKMFPRASAFKRFAEKVDDAELKLPVWGSIGTGGLAGLLAGSFIKNEVDLSKPLIFDDLERCTIPNDVLLGLINRYVEHHGCRVIVIAHDAKIVKSFAETKEKVFGQSLNVEPNVEEAFEEFVHSHGGAGKPDPLGGRGRDTLAVFREAQATSLRVLRHVVEDVGRLVAALDERHLANEPAMVEVVRLFSALAVEIRSNRLQRADLKRRGETIYAFRLDRAGNNAAEAEPPPIVVADGRYKSVDIKSTLFSDDTLIEMLCDGRYVAEHVREDLNRSAYFIEKTAAPPWQIVGSFDKLDDKDVEPALKRMNEQFEKREVTASGEFLHIVALKMMMASAGVSNETTRDVVDAAKAYVDDLLKAGSLPPRPAGWMWTDSFSSSYDGVAYWVADTYKAEFKEVFDYLVAARVKARERTLPTEAPALLEVMKADGQTFFEKVCHTRNGEIEYEDVPILAHIKPSEFVDVWLESPKTGWYWIANALKERNKSVPQYAALAGEAAWYAKVHREMQKRARSETGLARRRVERAAEQMGIPTRASRAARSAVARPKPRRHKASEDSGRSS